MPAVSNDRGVGGILVCAPCGFALEFLAVPGHSTIVRAAWQRRIGSCIGYSTRRHTQRRIPDGRETHSLVELPRAVLSRMTCRKGFRHVQLPSTAQHPAPPVAARNWVRPDAVTSSRGPVLRSPAISISFVPSNSRSTRRARSCAGRRSRFGRCAARVPARTCADPIRTGRRPRRPPWAGIQPTFIVRSAATRHPAGA